MAVRQVLYVKPVTKALWELSQIVVLFLFVFAFFSAAALFLGALYDSPHTEAILLFAEKYVYPALSIVLGLCLLWTVVFALLGWKFWRGYAPELETD